MYCQVKSKFQNNCIIWFHFSKNHQLSNLVLLYICVYKHSKNSNIHSTPHSKTKIMASGPLTSWQIDGEPMEIDFILGGSKITADGDCSHEIKRHFVLGRKVMNNLDSILKSRDITLPTKVCTVKAMVFPVVMYGCESWNIKKAKCWRIDTLNCGTGEDSQESLGLQGDPTSPS